MADQSKVPSEGCGNPKRGRLASRHAWSCGSTRAAFAEEINGSGPKKGERALF